MRRLLVLMVSLVLVGTLAGPASAGAVSVNAARNIIASRANGGFCNVSVDDVNHEVATICLSTGSTWFTVRVQGVGTGPLTAKAHGLGDCSGKTVKAKRKTSDVAVVRVRNAGQFECTYKRVTVRS